jgi:hypothetical protein
MNTHELAWCAGFFDGEGSTFTQLHLNKNHTGVQITFDVSQINPLLLYRFNEAIGGYGGLHRSQLRISNFEHVQYTMCLLWRWLGSIKKEQYKNATKKYLSICWKPKFDRLSVYRRNYNRYGSKAMKDKAIWNKISPSNESFINPFERAN